MTFTEIANRVGEDLNLTSPEAVARIGRRINERYRRVATSIGLMLTNRVAVTVPTVSGNPLIVVDTVADDIEKVVTVRDTTANLVLEECSLDEIRQLDPDDSVTGAPRLYAVDHHGASSVTLRLWPTPSDVRNLSIDALATKATLSGSGVPDFPASFHDVLIFGALADESRKIDKKQSEVFERQFEQRLSDLRFFLAKSSYLQRGARGGPRTHTGRSVTIVP